MLSDVSGVGWTELDGVYNCVGIYIIELFDVSSAD